MGKWGRPSSFAANVPDPQTGKFLANHASRRILFPQASRRFHDFPQLKLQADGLDGTLRKRYAEIRHPVNA